MRYLAPQRRESAPCRPYHRVRHWPTPPCRTAQGRPSCMHLNLVYFRLAQGLTLIIRLNLVYFGFSAKRVLCTTARAPVAETQSKDGKQVSFMTWKIHPQCMRLTWRLMHQYLTQYVPEPGTMVRYRFATQNFTQGYRLFAITKYLCS